MQMLCGHYFPLHPHPRLLGFNAALFNNFQINLKILFMETVIAVLYVQVVWFFKFFNAKSSVYVNVKNKTKVGFF